MKPDLKYLLSAGLLAAVIAAPAAAALKEGAIAPDFTAPASLDGKPFDYSLKEALKLGPVVVYFYPSAYTGGCNIQAHTFAVNHERFTAAGATILGVSLDSIDRLNAFSADPAYCAGKIIVASDADGAIARAFDLQVREVGDGKKDTRGAEIRHGLAERTTFIVTPNGRIAAALSGLKPADNVEQSLKAVQQLGVSPSAGR
ncbi:peroxiredoxin [uncultured Nevskia sp.]|uniref:peroxiredoxin n=1 Tax=uncultured Nevskia sp. TaxID=228950 RepID=UPI0025D320F6|nr:peroxiredoxin [uncultured Nevskia sp.]